MHILGGTFFLTYGALHAHFFKSFATLAITVAVLGACQHTPLGSESTKAGSNMAALEVAQTQSMINLKDVLDAVNSKYSNINRSWVCGDFITAGPKRVAKTTDGYSISANGSYA